ncbi:Uncharacterized membrane protein YdjX, TVP38/TMEM64 family, SNARE-associated domain [Roseicitreum antarcticum]|uniref:TVP38/TMEM64 family membrane protein n=1 Tax=Roseicitreum antarcticum TaxID=564137 RepID=A0A1H2X5D2_9RHOB|nr:Uncharacterized membrane protein YdjX, TVP38/TMEM64 family, SNARE-associated domain [Roseicitreum antarcticum]
MPDPDPRSVSPDPASPDPVGPDPASPDTAGPDPVGPDPVGPAPGAAKVGLRARLPLVIVIAVALTGAFLLRDTLTFDALRENREALLAFRDANYVLTAALFVLAYIAIVAFSLPGATAATLTGGFLFGVFPGAIFNVGAATLGATLIFLAVRTGLGAGLAARIDASDGRVKRLTDRIRDNEFSVLVSMRLVPVLPFFVANLIPALIGVRTGVFMLTTFLGIIPGGVIYTWVGAGLGAVFARGETPDLGIIFAPHILGPLLALAALAFLPSLLKTIMKKKEPLP